MTYRNNVSIISIQGIEIDEGSLWKFDPKLNLMILVDEDQYITAKPNDKQFTKIVLL
ncbi:MULTISPECIES: hypothetical protein [Weeksella]|uniref:hypothetical protein n=1 Tax=Weeksella TaxID=1013 RepID=UPI00143B78EE|nr:MULTISPECIES: hypothetical protein [Weeksella]MDK7375997.1 hypothetical protein [Weeksella virosa]